MFYIQTNRCFIMNKNFNLIYIQNLNKFFIEIFNYCRISLIT